MVGTIQRLASLCKVRRGFTGRCLNIRRPVSEILFETFEGVDSSNISFIKKHDVSYSCHSFCFTQWILLSTDIYIQHRPGCHYYRNQRFPKVMDLQPMMARHWRHSPLSLQKGNILHASVNQLSQACLLQKRIFRFTPAIPGDCTVPRICSECLPGFPQISRAQFSLLSFLSSLSAVQ